MNQQIRFAKSGLQLHINQSRNYADIVNAVVEYFCDCFHAEAAAYYSNTPDAYSIKFKWREFTIELTVTEVGITIKNLNPHKSSDSESIIDTLSLTFNGEACGTFKKRHLWRFRCGFSGYTNQVFEALFDVLYEDTEILDVEA